ncbi:MAG: hypothetical protein LBL13_04385 [Bacteroidales bacterium]|jgi:CheY-like chemotaxis protein|nr:hypothetical protein [Bacteroidales bacterium]
MKLEYNILWIDNDIQEYIDNKEVENLKSFLFDLGFEPKIVTLDDESNIDSYISQYQYDLIISDFNLNNENGDVIIYNIRNDKKIDTEILFYSAQTDFFNDAIVKDKLAFMERINLQYGRQGLMDKIEKVIKLNLIKLLELNATRGLITAATSDLDVKIEEIVMLIKVQQNTDEDKLKEYVTEKVFDPLQKRLRKFWENYGSFQEYFHKIDAIKKWEIFRALLKPMAQENNEIADFLKANKTYQEEVIELRNKFAHAKAGEKDGKTVLKGQLGKKDFEFDEAKCIEIRKKLILHKNSIIKLENILLAKQT